MFSASQVRTYGLWCQVNQQHTAGMGSNIGDWYYPTTGNTSDGFTLLPNTTDDTAPYQSLKCTNQIGLVVDGNVTNNQGIVRCTTTVPNLVRDTNYYGVYSDDVFNNFCKSWHDLNECYKNNAMQIIILFLIASCPVPH